MAGRTAWQWKASAFRGMTLPGRISSREEERVVMSKLQSPAAFASQAVIEVPGFAYFIPEPAKPAKPTPEESRAALAQMFGYYD